MSGSSDNVTVELGRVTIEALDITILGKTDTLLLAMLNPVGEYSGGFVLQNVLRKKFPARVPRFKVVDHHETGKFLVRFNNKFLVRKLHKKYMKWGEERISFWRVQSVYALAADTLDQDVETEKF